MFWLILNGVFLMCVCMTQGITRSEPGLLSLLRVQSKWFALVPWLVAILGGLFIVLKVIGYGYIPSDDARRHVAKAISGKSWAEVLVLRNDAPGDHNPGWHFLLRQLHLHAGFDADSLIAFSVGALWLLFMLSPLPWLKKPEAWVASILVFAMCNTDSFLRVSRGRPYIFGMALMLMVMCMWQFGKPARVPRVVLSIAIFALTAWVHGSWYLYVLIPVAFLFAGRLNEAKWLGASWVVGSFLGAVLTGDPFRHLYDELRIPFMCFGHHTLTRMLVTEFYPSSGDILVLMLVAGTIFAVRVLTGHWPEFWRSPFFWMGGLGWLLGLKTLRFWDDWGLPATMVWFALQLQELLPGGVQYMYSFKRAAFAVFCGLAAFFYITADRASVWTFNLTEEYLTPETEGIEGWLPEPGGIIYSSEMTVFYSTFFKNPNAPWRYILGFEPTFMPQEDLEIYRNIQWNYGESKAYEPWVKKMRPEDRLILIRGPSNQPKINGLEWHYAASHIWIGRKPRAGSSTNVQPATIKTNILE